MEKGDGWMALLPPPRPQNGDRRIVPTAGDLHKNRYSSRKGKHEGKRSLPHARTARTPSVQGSICAHLSTAESFAPQTLLPSEGPLRLVSGGGSTAPPPGPSSHHTCSRPRVHRPPVGPSWETRASVFRACGCV